MNPSSTPEMQTYRRKLSALERLRFRLPNPNVVLMAQLEGAVTVDHLAAAIHKVQQRHPLLRAAIRLDDDSNAWFTSKHVPAIPGPELWQKCHCAPDCTTLEPTRR